MTEAAETVAIHMRAGARRDIAEGRVNRMAADPVLFAQEMRTNLYDRGIITVEPHWHTIRRAYRRLFS